MLGATLLYCRGRLQREEGVIHVVAEDLRDLTPRLNTLRQRTGAELSDPKPPLKLSGRASSPSGAPGPRDLYEPDIVVQSRDFR